MSSRSSILAWPCLAMIAFGSSASLECRAETDLRRAVPASVHMAVFAKRNTERDYQREYLKQAWETAQEERIGQRIIDLVTSRMPKEKLEEVESAWEDVREAIDPISAEAIANAEEFVFAQQLSGMFNQQLFGFLLSEEDAKDCEQGIKQVFELAVKWSDGKLTVETTEAGDVEVTTLRLPKESPFQPSVARVENAVLICSSPELLEASVAQLAGGSGESKFDDPRFQEAMEHLPEPEDVVVFFDGKQLSKSLSGVADSIREKAPDDEKALRAAKLMERFINEFSILDYEITVEETEDGQNRAVALGRLTDDAEEKLLGKALTQGDAFEDWQSWVPAEAKGFKMTTGLNLHVLYEGILEIVREEFPESEEGLQKFAEVQEKIGVNLDEDILQSFSGECVTVRFVVDDEDGKEAPHGVTALKCDNPEKIRELLGRALEKLQELPPVAAQNLEVVDVEDLEGFQEIRANIFAPMGARPVIGFKDGWMFVSSHVDAARQLLEVRAGDADSIEGSELLEDFDMEAEDEVYAVSYSNVGDAVRAAADGIDKAGMMLPMFVGMAAAQAPEKDRETIMEVIGLLPSIAKVVREFDFFEDRLSVTQEGPLEDSYIRHTSIKIRQADADEDKESEEEEEAETAEVE